MITNIAFFLLIVLLLLNMLQYIAHYIERRDLYNRLMCRDMNEYRMLNRENKPPPLSAHRRILDRWRKLPEAGGDR